MGSLLKSWTHTFYRQQYKLLERRAIWPQVWDNQDPENPPPRVRLIERYARPGTNRILELGCGSGIISGALAAAGNQVVALDMAPIAAAHARHIAGSLPEGQMQVTDFDPQECRLVNTIRHREHPEESISQSLRCYSPADLEPLLTSTGLEMVSFQGYESGHHARQVSLDEAPLYFAKRTAVGIKGQNI